MRLCKCSCDTCLRLFYSASYTVLAIWNYGNRSPSLVAIMHNQQSNVLRYFYTVVMVMFEFTHTKSVGLILCVCVYICVFYEMRLGVDMSMYFGSCECLQQSHQLLCHLCVQHTSKMVRITWEVNSRAKIQINVVIIFTLTYCCSCTYKCALSCLWVESCKWCVITREIMCCTIIFIVACLQNTFSELLKGSLYFICKTQWA